VARLSQLHVHSNGTTVPSNEDTSVDSSTSLAAGQTDTMGSVETLTGSSYTQLHHVGNYPSPAQQAYPVQGHQHMGGQQVHLGSQQAYQGNPAYLTNYSAHPVHQPNLGNPAYQVNPSQFTRHLHHYDPTQVNTSYSPSNVLHHQMHAAHPHQAHHYGNSGFSFKR